EDDNVRFIVPCDSLIARGGSLRQRLPARQNRRSYASRRSRSEEVSPAERFFFVEPWFFLATAALPGHTRSSLKSVAASALFCRLSKSRHCSTFVLLCHKSPVASHVRSLVTGRTLPFQRHAGLCACEIATARNARSVASRGAERISCGRDQRSPEEVMGIKTAGAGAIFASCTFIGATGAQDLDLGPQVKKLADGVYVHTGRGFESDSGIILTQDGVIVIDTGQNPYESRNIWATVRNLTSMPVRLIIDTEPHADHTTGHYMFSPPAVVIAAAGAGESMRTADRNAPDRIQRLAATSPEFRAALEGYRFVTPHVEYHDRMTINLGGRAPQPISLHGRSPA